MSDPYRLRFEQDRALRDAARDLVQQDVDFLRGDNARRSAAERIGDRAGAKASSLAGKAFDFASANSGAVTTGVALAGVVIALTIFRQPLIATICEWIGIDPEQEQAPPPPHSIREQES